ncbi:hypothetical protein C8R42DRAFT_394069 [Lentinula raphanica]|nr:hypothetical protein C8R42DRAFT_394069 [Lentinula raphanica]
MFFLGRLVLVYMVLSSDLEPSIYPLPLNIMRFCLFRFSDCEINVNAVLTIIVANSHSYKTPIASIVRLFVCCVCGETEETPACIN